MQPPQQVSSPSFWQRGWPEGIASVLAFVGLIAAVFLDFDPHGSQNAGSDFKTLYASAWCYSHHLDAYQFHHLAAVFRANSVVEPVSWYGHAPVYPPFTLALLAPLTMMPMVPALSLWIVMSGILTAWATISLADSARRVFGVPLVYRLLIVALVACSPLLSLGLELGNVSVAVAALCILAMTSKSTSRGWIPAFELATALILKPHIAFWAVLAMLLSHKAADRRLLVKTVMVTAVALGVILAGMLLQGGLLAQAASYRAMVLSELSNGSMAPGNRDLLEIIVQITSFAHLLGYELGSSVTARTIDVVVLLGLGTALVWSSLRFSRRWAEPRYMIAPAVFAFGLLATYHREADSMVLLFLLPLLAARFRSNWRDLWAWSALLLLVAGSIGPSLATMRWLVEREGIFALGSFLALRQAAVVDLCLAVLLIWSLAFESSNDRTATPEEAESV